MALSGPPQLDGSAAAPGFPDQTLIEKKERIPEPAILYLPGGRIAAVNGAAGVPYDTDRDGLYDTVNGNGRADFADVVLYFNQMTWIADNEPVSAFDYNTNGRIDFADVVWLFNNL